MTDMRDYDESFYAEGREYAFRSAQRIVPIVCEWVQPRSVVDIGCGVGTWLSVFATHGVEEILGVDGAHVDTAALEIPGPSFAPRDLATAVDLERGFDLAMSVEVAEHLPPSRADGFVAELCRLAPVVLFSAAVPGQGGVHHVNEQWQDYWAERFAAQGFACVDAIRPRCRDDGEVSWWYRQNLMLFANDAALAAHPILRASVVPAPARRVEPELVERNHHRMRLQNALLEILAHVPAGGRVLVADAGQLFERGPRLARDFEWVPFPSRDGKPWGAPVDGASALGELARERVAGADTIAIVFPAFWWLDHYAELGEGLRGLPVRSQSLDCVVYEL